MSLSAMKAVLERMVCDASGHCQRLCASMCCVLSLPAPAPRRDLPVDVDAVGMGGGMLICIVEAMPEWPYR